jgi:esterase/lipase superfamily enzyme
MKALLMRLSAIWAFLLLFQVAPSWGATPNLCDNIVGLSVDRLESERLTLERELAPKDASPRTADAKQATSNSTDDSQELDKKRSRLIDVLYELQCFRPDMEHSEEVLRGTVATLTMPLLYATNRKPKENALIDDFYGYDDTQTLAYGLTSISIPSLHRPGEVELPSLWKLEWSSNPAKHFRVTSITPLSPTEARDKFRDALENAKTKSLLLFVHGYNVSFVEASYRTAQLAYDLRFPGPAMFYSWPSAGKTSGYFHDEESARLAVRIFDQLLDDISSLNVQEVYVVAHSMGNRVVADALADRIRTGKEVSKIRELLLAAPDINVEVFKTEIAPFLAKVSTARKTIYASSQDLALMASHVIHGFSRVGDTKNGVVVYPSFDTIDASAAAPLERSFGHSYVLDSNIVLNDVEDVILWHRPTAERTLRTLGIAPNSYWAIQ